MFPCDAVLLDRLSFLADHLMCHIWYLWCWTTWVCVAQLSDYTHIWKIDLISECLPVDPCWMPDLLSTASTMTAIKHALQRDIFTPNDERLLCIVNVCKAGKKKKNCFLCATGRQACSRLRQWSGSIKPCCVCEILLPPLHQSHHGETCPGESGEGEEVWQGGFLQTAADMGAPRSDRSGCQRCQQGQKTVCTLSYLTATLWE